MPIEAFQWISNLVSAYPQGGDTKSQGDDHIRGVKQTLQNTFPDADRAFRIPRTRSITTTTPLTIADSGRYIDCPTGAGNISLSLPSGLTANDTFDITIAKASADSNYVVITPPSGVINGAFTAIYIYTFLDPHRFVWTGSVFRRIYNGVPPGVMVTFFAGGITPIGWRVCDGSTLSPSTNYPELVLARGTPVIPNVANSIIRLC
jgi:hypothetical protein